MRLKELILNQSLKKIAYILMFANYCYLIFFTYIMNRNNDGYILGDWLINYEDGGFKRRGLSGSFFFKIQDVFGVSLNHSVLIFQFILYTILFYYLFRLIKKKKIDILFFSLLISPLAFLAYFNTVTYVGKKDFFYLTFLTFTVYSLSNDNFNKAKENLICVLLFVSMFFHEVILFFIPYIILAIYLKKGWSNSTFIKIFLSVLIPAVLIFFLGGEINNGQSIDLLKSRGVKIDNGILFWNINERSYIYNHINQYILYFVSMIISCAHILYYIKKRLYSKKLIMILIVILIYTLPLFYLAIDWGRWMYLHFISITIIFAEKLYDCKEDSSGKKEKLIIFNKEFYIASFFIIISMLYRVEMSGRGFTFEGLIYRLFIIPTQLLDKVL